MSTMIMGLFFSKARVGSHCGTPGFHIFTRGGRVSLVIFPYELGVIFVMVCHALGSGGWFYDGTRVSLPDRSPGAVDPPLYGLMT